MSKTYIVNIDNHNPLLFRKNDHTFADEKWINLFEDDRSRFFRWVYEYLLMKKLLI